MASASSTECDGSESAIGIPSLFIVFLNSMRSSPLSIASAFTPMISTPYFFNIPCLCSDEQRLSAVCPPRFGRIPSGRSFSIIVVKLSTVSGSIYVLSAIPGSVMIVAGLEFTKITSKPSSLNALQACVPE